jgi:hypothetical protein
VAHSGKDVRSITLDLHAAASAVALLPTPEFAIEEGLIDLQSGWHAGKKGNESLPVRFSGREIAEHCSGLYLMR